MLVLAIDCALDACAAAVLESETGSIVASETRLMARGHAEALMPLIARVMDEAAVEFKELDRIAVTVGPGSFTGLRVGISAARGIALAAGKPAIGVTTLSALAAPHIAEHGQSPVMAAIDARHEHVYVQVFAPGGRSLVPPRIATLREAARAAASGNARIVGSAAVLVAQAWPKGELPPVALDQRAAPDIAWIARLGAAGTDTGSSPRPLYLRGPDAVPQPTSAKLKRR
ncbi:MAG TPA: tRNA (adenosine(37)-N6)-threonylcarbamoyltransferase complex dimerization subunit type 1 TsaB [Xanthobacteraceae bacterium]|jgi:tRNA threonylcarbamoyl adenosine modification protein YeaZ|nr:tRNA (adenosine(37)-N6)-threonylcarbamoyltransferase complex dimerization subunit type 1 TsaB [Xanthobacteraceae bacterium]